MHRRSFVGVLAVAALALACDAEVKPVRGSGTAKTEARSVGAFTGVEVAGAVHVAITVGRPASVSVTADDNLVDRVTTRVDGERLRIATAGSYSPKVAMTVAITTPSLVTLALSGATSADVRGLAGDPLAVALAGASKATLAGTARQVSIDVGGASQLDAEQLVAGDATVAASGASRAVVHATGTLTVDARGASEVGYRGQPTVRETTSGTSRVAPR